MIIRWSISLKLTMWFGGIFFLGWLLFGAAMWWNLRSTLIGERYGTLARREYRLERLLARTSHDSDAARAKDFSEFARATGHGLSEVRHADNGQIYFPPTSTALKFPWPDLHGFASEDFEQVRWEGQGYWVLGHPFSFGNEHLYLLAAAPESGNDLVLSRFLAGLLASIPVLLLISSAGGYFLSRRALLPVDRITTAARSISIRNLSERLPVADTGDEIERLAQTCNAMLARLEAAVNRIEQFTADASHELRGPLSFVRTVAEVALHNPQTDADSRQAFTDIVEETAKATVLLEDMLTLARADAERGTKALELLNLADVIEQAWEMARPIADQRKLELRVSIQAKLVSVLGDFMMLRRLLWILLDNALKYTHAPGKIDLALSMTDTRATVTVRDSGPGISEKDLPHIFDRFYRADPSRSQIDGMGLGLSIAKWIADMHDADLTVTSQMDKGSVFRLELPVFSEAPIFLESSA